MIRFQKQTRAGWLRKPLESFRVSFIQRRIIQRLCKQTRRMHQRYFYALCGIILRLQKEVIGSGLENTFKNHENEHSGHDENNFFSILFSTLQLFFNPLFFAFLQQFTPGENLRVAGAFWQPCSERIFLGTPVLPSRQNPTFSRLNSISRNGRWRTTFKFFIKIWYFGFGFLILAFFSLFLGGTNV